MDFVAWHTESGNGLLSCLGITSSMCCIVLAHYAATRTWLAAVLDAATPDLLTAHQGRLPLPPQSTRRNVTLLAWRCGIRMSLMSLNCMLNKIVCQWKAGNPRVCLLMLVWLWPWPLTLAWPWYSTYLRYYEDMYLHTKNEVVLQGFQTLDSKHNTQTHFLLLDLDLDPMTLMYKVDLSILKVYLRTENEVSRSRLSEVRARTGQTRRQTGLNVLPRRIHRWWW